MVEGGCLIISGAVVDGVYRDYMHGGTFTPDGEIVDNSENGHPIFENDGGIIQLEYNQGFVDFPMTADEYIQKFSIETTEFNSQ